MKTTSTTFTKVQPDKFDALETSSGQQLLMRGCKISKAFGGQVVLDNTNFELYAGEVVVLQGVNGSGKTTLLNILTGNLEPDSGILDLRTNGDTAYFKFPRKWWQNLNPLDHFLPECVAREGIGRSWQDIRIFPSINLIDNITTATPKHPGESPFNVLFRPQKVKKAEEEAQKRAKIRLTDLGLHGRETSSGGKVSLGQSKRAAIARAVEGGAKVLFLDEPLAALDATGIADVMDLLRKLVKEHRITLVIIEHVWNVQHVAPLATTLWDLVNGKITIKKHNNDDKESLLNGQTWTDITELFPDYSLTRTQNFPRGAQLDIYRRENAQDSENILEIKDLVVKRNNLLVIGENGEGEQVHGLNFLLQAGDLAVLHAQNGWGKTTLLDYLTGCFSQIEFENITDCQKDCFRTSYTYLRSARDGFPSLTTQQITKLYGGEISNTNIRFGQLSGGQKQIFLLRLKCYQNSDFLLLDEPFSGLDLNSIREVVNLIYEHHLNINKRSCLIVLPNQRMKIA